MKHAKNRAEKLRSEIEEHRYRYYVLDDPAISDSAYDALVRELEELESKYPGLQDPSSPTQRVGAEPLESFDSVKHITPMLSLNNALNKEELISWHERVVKLLDTTPKLHLDIKMDGLAAAVVYENGQLNLGLTRGDGYTGEDVTSNIKTIGSIPLRLRPGLSDSFYNSRVEVRGEILIYKEDFVQINAQRQKEGQPLYANPRNLAAGSIRQLDPKLAAARPLRFHAYRVLTQKPIKTLSDEYEIAHQLGFVVNKQHKTASNLDEVSEFIDKLEKERFDLPFQNDGVVIMVNDTKQLTSLGVVGKAPRGAIAYKYPAEQAVTHVQDIRVNVGRTGAVTPFAVLEPVQIAGTTVQMATLHNEGEIKRKDIRIGDSVIVHKAGDIIPEVVESIKRLRDGSERVFEMPKVCPDCGKALKKKATEAVWRCVNRSCPAQSRRQIEHFASKNAFDIDGLGEQIVAVLLDNKLIEDMADLYALRVEDVEDLERFGEKSAQNLVEAIKARKRVSLDRFIFGLGIRHVGRQTAIDLAQNFKSLEKIAEASAEELEQVEGIGTVVAEAIDAWFCDPDNQNLLKKLESMDVRPVEMKQTDNKLAGKTFVITGTLGRLSRDEVAEKIRSLGGKVQSSVSAGTDYLVVGEKPGSNKLKEAEKHKTRQVNETRLLEILKS